MSLIPTIPGTKKKGRRNVPRSLQPTPEAAKSRLARLRRKQLMQRRDLRHEMLVQPKALPPASDPLGP